MKTNLPVTNKEFDYDDDLEIISTTNLKGIITYCNDDFCKVCGFSQDELLKKNHNIVRHPDMPPAAFADLWQTLKEGKPWMGIVKNRCKNGDHYWVDAYVTPIFEGGRIIGYQSVRVKPKREDVQRAEIFYAGINNPKKKRFRLPSLGVKGRLFSIMAALLLGAGASLGILADISWEEGLIVSIPALISAYLAAWIFTRPIIDAAQEAAHIVDNPVMQQVYVGRSDEIGKPLLALRMLKACTRTVLGRVTDAADNLAQEAKHTADVIAQSQEGVLKQQQETEMLATAMNEMAASSREVANNTEHASQAVGEADQNIQQGMQVMDQIFTTSKGVSHEIGQAAEVIRALDNHSKNIEVVVEVIKGIADQINLLALNAAIEAARAGDQGRGFAVVANEVRTLAQRTHDSTMEIEKMITDLQSGTNHAVVVMKDSCEQARQSLECATAGSEALDGITQQIANIKDMNQQVACAAVEQSNVAEEINRNLTEISRLAKEVAHGAQQNADANDRQDMLVQQFKGMTRQFAS